MSQVAIVTLNHLDSGFILAPERYDPRRRATSESGITIADVAEVISEQFNPKKPKHVGKFLVLDTSDAREGLILFARGPISPNEIGSTKKIIKPGDVIISRLRPYLRQVAYVDEALTKVWTDNITIVCSTEFYVLRSRDSQSIAFLVPLLLNKPNQEILSVSQEGGHHPRFNQNTLETVSIPEPIMSKRDTISRSVELAVAQARQADISIRFLILDCST